MMIFKGARGTFFWRHSCQVSRRSAEGFVRNCASKTPVTSNSNDMFSQTKGRLKMRLILTVDTTLCLIDAKFQDNLRRCLSEIVHSIWLRYKVPMIPSSDEVFSQTKRRLKMRLIGTVGTTVSVMHVMFQENQPRGSSEIVPPSWL